MLTSRIPLSSVNPAYLSVMLSVVETSPFHSDARLRDKAEIPRPAFARGYGGQAKLGMTAPFPIL